MPSLGSEMGLGVAGYLPPKKPEKQIAGNSLGFPRPPQLSRAQLIAVII